MDMGQQKAAYTPTDKTAMGKFLALILMGYAHLIQLENYWSTHPTIGDHAIYSNVMIRAIFYSLMQSITFN